jgi:hypothetical protein
LSNTRYAKTKKTTVNIESIYFQENTNYSDSESDNNHDSSATLIDSDNTVIDSDNTVSEENDHGNEPEHMTIYPDISTLLLTFE